MAFAASREVAQLQEAIARRDVIGQAKGILMERYKVTEDRAFLLLAKISNHRNTKLYEVASQLVRTGTVTGASPNP
ncbi:ANTAR domain-containing protein [Nesterenkonia sphaerica]|uniref:ANTAR domain-containing protein n=1 Tax=Nesterenkonia sphaerica TaxID=1804988 RepID=A0A5R8ZZC9_9MICC|nr:ANTAR domain-containing protein [Nesterenkonia sphaerica]TLP71789.1 ANTAR domain-containing protein [Nesterenkonia sphaerica]